MMGTQTHLVFPAGAAKTDFIFTMIAEEFWPDGRELVLLRRSTRW